LTTKKKPMRQSRGGEIAAVVKLDQKERSPKQPDLSLQKREKKTRHELNTKRRITKEGGGGGGVPKNGNKLEADHGKTGRQPPKTKGKKRE